ncbi:unnamed protein product [Symbiodinium sp. KB8]|nr:unnamed protein product [Symbiodinium sp. KB8]
MLLGLTGDLEMNVPSLAEAGFRLACYNGHIDVVCELLALTGDRAVDVHAGFDGRPGAGFWIACANGHIEVVHELLTLSEHREVDVHVDGEDGFRVACEHGHVDVVRELLALTGSRRIPTEAREAARKFAELEELI